MVLVVLVDALEYNDGVNSGLLLQAFLLRVVFSFDLSIELVTCEE
jgi:hypothetical protein